MKEKEKEKLREEEVIERERRWQERGRWEKIGGSRYNKWYGRVKGKEVPGYLKRGWKEEKWQRIARVRLEDGMKGGRYWEEKEDRRCRGCGWGEETWEHVWEECTNWGVEKRWQEMMEVVLGEEGKEEGWMRKLEVLREGNMEGGGRDGMDDMDEIETIRKKDASETEVPERR